MRNRPFTAALLQLHSIIGLTVSLFLAVIALTGALMSFEDEIGAALNAAIMHVEPRPVPALSPDALITKLQTQDFGRVAAVTLASDPAAAVRIRLARSEGGSRPTSVYVAPYDGHVLGVPRGEDFFITVRRLHRWLLLPGDAKGYGRPLTGVIAIGLVVMLISGLVLRWPRNPRSIRMWLKPNLALPGRGFHRSVHAVVSTWVMLIYLVMALTGLWYSFDWYRDGAVWLFSERPAAPARMQQTPPKSQPKSPRIADAAPLTLDRAWTTFLQTQGERFATAQLTLPAGTGTAIRIRSWPHEAWHDGARDEFRIDAVTGEMISSEIYATKSTGDKILSDVLDIHRGSILGWPGQLLFMLAALLMPLIAFTGLMLYLTRRKLRRATAPMPTKLAPPV